MLITSTQSDFFNVLTGKNSQIIEQCIISLYEALYGNDFIVDEVLHRKRTRDIIYKVLQEIPWQNEENENNYLENDKDKAAYIIKRLKECGWIDFVMDKALLIKTFSFTKHGKNFAQTLYASSDEENVLVRQKNVRATKASLLSYQNSNDPADLIDAINSSKYIVSDLSDNIADLKEEKNLLMKLAMEDVKVAGNKFIDFVKDKFVSDIAIKFGKDSANRYILDIEELVKDLSIKDYENREKRLYSHFPIFKKNKNALKAILDAIDNRLKNACDTKLPQLKKEISSYIHRGSVIFKQTNSLYFNKNTEVFEFAKLIKEKNAKEKNELLNKLGKSIKIPNIKLFNTKSIKIRRAKDKEEIISLMPQNVQMPKNAYIKSEYEQKKHLSFSYSQKEIKDYINKCFEKNDTRTITNHAFEINSAKDLLIALYASDIMKNDKDYKLEYTNNRCENVYFNTNEFTITKKDKTLEE